MAVALGGLHSVESPAQAADSPQVVELSSDGASYSRSMSALFGPVVLTPLSNVQDDFWVRNSGSAPAYLTVMVTDTHVPDSDLAAALTLSAGLSDDISTLPLPPLGSCMTLEAGHLMAPGEEVRIASELSLGDLNGTRGQGTNLDFNLRVLLSDQQLTQVGDSLCAVIPEGGDNGGGSDGSGNNDGGTGGNGNTGNGGGSSSAGGSGSGSPGMLETTGATLSAVLGWGAVLAALGLVLVFFKRRRPRER